MGAPFGEDFCGWEFGVVVCDVMWFSWCFYDGILCLFDGGGWWVEVWGKKSICR